MIDRGESATTRMQNAEPETSLRRGEKQNARLSTSATIHKRNRLRSGGEQPGFAFKPELAPKHDETVFVKQVNSAFIGTELESWLHEHEYETLIIAGLTTDHCVSTTAHMAENLDFHAIVVSDATATFGQAAPDGTAIVADDNHQAALAHLQDEFATIEDSEQVLSNLS